MHSFVAGVKNGEKRRQEIITTFHINYSIFNHKPKAEITTLYYQTQSIKFQDIARLEFCIVPPNAIF